MWSRGLVHDGCSINAHCPSLAHFPSWGGKERWRLLEDKAQRWSPQGWRNSSAAGVRAKEDSGLAEIKS